MTIEGFSWNLRKGNGKLEGGYCVPGSVHSLEHEVRVYQ